MLHLVPSDTLKRFGWSDRFAHESSRAHLTVPGEPRFVPRFVTYFERNPALDNLGLTPGTRSPDS